MQAEISLLHVSPHLYALAEPHGDTVMLVWNTVPQPFSLSPRDKMDDLKCLGRLLIDTVTRKYCRAVAIECWQKDWVSGFLVSEGGECG